MNIPSGLCAANFRIIQNKVVGSIDLLGIAVGAAYGRDMR